MVPKRFRSQPWTRTTWSFVAGCAHFLSSFQCTARYQAIASQQHGGYVFGLLFRKRGLPFIPWAVQKSAFAESDFGGWLWPLTIPTVTRWPTTSSAPCCPSSTTTSSWSQGKVVPARPRPPRKSCNSTPSAVRARNSWTTSATGCFSPTQCSRSATQMPK